jgi:hypothetical protein
MMTEGTTGFARSHASERRAGLHPRAFAIGAITSRIFQVRFLSTTGSPIQCGANPQASGSSGFLPESQPEEEPHSGAHWRLPLPAVPHVWLPVEVYDQPRFTSPTEAVLHEDRRTRAS